MSDLITDAHEKVMKAIHERLEKELRGAWRAGYDYVHVYAEPPGKALAQPLDESVTFTQYILPTNQKIPPQPETRYYRYTYDLTSVSDKQIRERLKE